MQTDANKKRKRKPVSKQEHDAILKALVQSALIKDPEGTAAQRVCFELLGLLPKRQDQEITPLSRLIQGKMWELLEAELDGKVEIYQVGLDKFNRVRVEIIEDLNQRR